MLERDKRNWELRGRQGNGGNSINGCNEHRIVIENRTQGHNSQQLKSTKIRNSIIRMPEIANNRKLIRLGAEISKYY